FDVDVRTARARMLRRVRPAHTPDRMEQEPNEFYERVCAAYRDLAAGDPARFCLIDASQTADAIEGEVWQQINSRLGSRLPTGSRTASSTP
ncbi:MAG: hypothetical protein M3Z64_02165, partial [Verrucomicrobiota bacterium]|nr:hypothetical protein [Verrucomicrobiota bacterium]